MRSLVLLIALLIAWKIQAQSLIGSMNNISLVPDLKYEEEMITLLLSASNSYVSTLNIIHFKDQKRKSNAGFLLFPGLFQLSLGALKAKDEPTKAMDLAFGATSVIICAARMIYTPKQSIEKSFSLLPYYQPLKSARAGGLCLKWKF